MNYLIRCDKKRIELEKPIIMGILNLTPDSFFEGSRTNLKTLLTQAEAMLTQGATILDVGGVSTRPFADKVEVFDELARVIPAIQALKKHFPETILSIDTFRSEVAKIAVQEGVNIINDISGGSLDPKMFEMVASLQVPYILMHLKGIPQTMQLEPNYENVTIEVMDYFTQKIAELRHLGVKDIILDLGFGFGKTAQHNYTLLRELSTFQLFELPILVGISRKSMIYKCLHTTPKDALNGTTFLHAFALQNGANILRVHDVKEAIECIKLYEMVRTTPYI